MEQGKYDLKGYRFRSKDGYTDAKKEWEAIEYLRAKTDLSKGENALKLYNQLVHKNYFRTVIGYDFLKELSDIAVSSGVIARERLLPINVQERSETPVIPQKEKSVRQLEKEAETYRTLYEDLKTKKNCARVVIIFLILMLTGCVVITFLSDNTLVTDYRTRVENEYVEWQEQLQEKEAELNEREKNLQEKMNENPDTFTE